MAKALPTEQPFPPRFRSSEAGPFEGCVRVELHDHATPLGIRIGPYRHIEVDMVRVIRVPGDANIAEIHTRQHTPLKWGGVNG